MFFLSAIDGVDHFSVHLLISVPAVTSQGSVEANWPNRLVSLECISGLHCGTYIVFWLHTSYTHVQGKRKISNEWNTVDLLLYSIKFYGNNNVGIVSNS